MSVNSMKIAFVLKAAEDYPTWAFAMTVMLDVHGLLETVVPGTTSSTATTAEVAVNKAKAMNAIVKNIDGSQMGLIMTHAGNPAGAWKALKEEHAGNTSQDVATLLVELNSRRLKRGATEEDVKNFFSEMANLQLRLAAANSERAISDADMAIKLLMALPDDYEPIKLMRLNGTADALTSKTIRADVLALIRRKAIAAQDDAPQQTALMGNPRNGRQQRRQQAFKGACYSCGKTGHRKANCWEDRAAKNGDNKQARNGHAAIALMSMSLAGGGRVAPRKGVRDFIVDNAAPCGHVSTQRAHFKNLTTTPGNQRDSIGGIGGDRVQVIGRGDVSLRLANGQGITLKNVAYVPKAVANIFAVQAALAKLGKEGTHVELYRSTKLSLGGKTIATSTLRGGFYYLDLNSEQDFV
jgi:hypothetical protein